MTRKRVAVGLAGFALVAAFGAGLLVARATPGGATRNKLSFAGNVQPVPAAGATLSFTFNNADDSTTCTTSAGSPSFDTSGNFVAEVDLSACPASFAFNGGNVTYSIAVNGTAIGTAQPVNPVPYAKYADKVAYDVKKVSITTTSYSGALSATDATGATVKGYAAARAICQQFVGTKTAHFCTNEEMVRYVSGGGDVAQVARSAGGYSATASGFPVTDCDGFQNQTASNGVLGSIWGRVALGPDAGFGQPGPNVASCSTSYPILCCD